MPFPLVRFTVRRMMVVVAIVAVLAGTACWLARRRVRFLAIAATHRASGFGIDPSSRYYDFPGDWALKEVSPRNRWHAEMSFRYRYAADHPWLLVPPDPPEPE